MRLRDCNPDGLRTTNRSRRLLALRYWLSVKHKNNHVAIRRRGNPYDMSPLYKCSILAKDAERFPAGVPSRYTRLGRPARAQLQYGAVTCWGGYIIEGSAQVVCRQELRDLATRGDYS